MTKVTTRPFGSWEGRDVTLYTLDNGETSVSVMGLGAALQSICTKDKEGNTVDVLLGYDTPQEYMSHGGYLGACIGRHANRIKNASFDLNGKTYQVNKNENNNNLHGGPNGYDRRFFDVQVITLGEDQAIACKLYDEDMSAGFPGNVTVTVVYSLSADNALKLDYTASTDADTVVNLTNHAYFNLNGSGSGTIVNHKMKIYAPFYTPVDEDCCPTGEILSVKGTVFDFTDFTTIADGIDQVPDMAITGGYDHNWVLDAPAGQLNLAAETIGDKTGIRLKTYTDLPGIQFYAGNGMDECKGKNGVDHHKRDAFCLETQYFPNSTSIPFFPTPFLKAGETYHSVTVYQLCKE